MIMADNKFESQISNQNEANTSNTIEETSRIDRSESCSCTNISTMQLFYEMKQKFPGVPDNVVCDYVNQNCHNRSACIDELKDYPNLTNVYPQALRSQRAKKNSQRHLMTVNPNCNQSNIKNNQNRHRIQMGAINDKQDQWKVDDAQVVNEINNENTEPNICDIENKQQQHQRPNTLNLINLDSFMQPTMNRPTRTAPHPPMKSLNTEFTQQKQITNKPLNLSLNVIVSPVSSHPAALKPERTPQSHSTSLSFTLHQPNSSNSNNNQIVTIPVTSAASSPNFNRTNDEMQTKFNNDPSLKYTSSAFDPQIGYQSRLEITVIGSNLSNEQNLQFNENASKQNDFYSLPVIQQNNHQIERNSQQMTKSSLPSVSASSMFLEESN